MSPKDMTYKQIADELADLYHSLGDRKPKEEEAQRLRELEDEMEIRSTEPELVWPPKE